MAVMWIIGAILIYLAIKKEMEPSLLLPMGFGVILVNLPMSGAITQGTEEGALSVLFDAGIANELFPLILFIGIGAMIDFGPLLSNPKMLLFGAAAQFVRRTARPLSSWRTISIPTTRLQSPWRHIPIWRSSP